MDIAEVLKKQMMDKACTCPSCSVKNTYEGWQNGAAFVTREVAREKHRAFLDEVQALRLKYQIADMFVMVVNNAKNGEDNSDWGHEANQALLGQKAIVMETLRRFVAIQTGSASH